MFYYLKNLAISLDQLLNTLFLGWPDETLSARAYRLRRDGIREWPANLIDKLFFWQEHHCLGAWRYEQRRMHISPEYRTQQDMQESVTETEAAK